MFISCTTQNNSNNNLKANMEKNNPCGISDNEINSVYIQENVDKIVNNEPCLNIILNFLNNKIIIEKDLSYVKDLEIVSKKNPSEDFGIYIQELFEKEPFLILTFMIKNKNSSLENTLVNAYNIDTEMGDTKNYFTVINKVENSNRNSHEINIVLNNLKKKIKISFKAIVNDPDGFVNLRDGKGTQYDVVKKIENGTKVMVIDTSNDWRNVETEEGLRGFIHKSRLEELK